MTFHRVVLSQFIEMAHLDIVYILNLFILPNSDKIVTRNCRHKNVGVLGVVACRSASTTASTPLLHAPSPFYTLQDVFGSFELIFFTDVQPEAVLMRKSRNPFGGGGLKIHVDNGEYGLIRHK